MTSQQKKQAINIIRQAARLRAMQWDLESDLESIIGVRNGIGELIDTYATDIERPASEATHLEKLIPARELKYFTELEAD